MKRLEIPTQGGLIGHYADVPVGTQGAVYLLNVTPFDKQGILLWRPMCQLGTENEDWARITSLPVADVCCSQDGIVVAALDSANGKTRVFWWKPGQAPVELTPVPLPDDGKTVQASFAATGFVLAVDGWGIWYYDWDEETQGFKPPMRIGSLGWTTGSGSVALTVSEDTELLQVSFQADADVWLTDVTLFLARRAEFNGDGQFTLEVEDSTSAVHQALESYSVSGLPVAMEGEPVVFTPLSFTFNKRLRPPIKLRFKVLSGSVEVLLEGGGGLHQGAKTEVTFSSVQLHVHVGGTMCPNEGIVGVNRGAIFGVADYVNVQVCSVADFSFLDEFVFDQDVVALAPVGDSIAVFSRGKVSIARGWMQGAVQIRTVLQHGIPEKRFMTKVSDAVVVLSAGRLWAISEGGASPLAQPFFNLKDDAYVVAVPHLDVVMVAFAGSEFALVVNYRKGWTVWWRFDEVDRAIPLFATGNILLFSNGNAYVFDRGQDAGWPSYECVVAFSTGLIDPASVFQVQAVEVDGQILDEASLWLYWVNNDSVGRAYTQIPAPNLVLLDDSWVGGWYGIPFGTPDAQSGQKARLPLARPKAFVSADALRSFGSEDAGFPAGYAFLVVLQLPQSAFKHIGALLRKFVLLGEQTGGAYNG